MLVNGSGKVHLLKRDGSCEEFNSQKLAASIFRGMKKTREGGYRDALDLAIAIGIYIREGRSPCISSSAVFEMTLKVLRNLQFEQAAAEMETYRFRRVQRRRQLRIAHADGRVTHWDKGWLAKIGGQSWRLGAGAARIIAAEVEAELLTDRQDIAFRQDVLELFNQRVAAYGLADAVPVEQ